MPIFANLNQYLKEQSRHGDVNRDIRRMAKDVEKHAPKPDPKKILVSFNASTIKSAWALGLGTVNPLVLPP